MDTNKKLTKIILKLNTSLCTLCLNSCISLWLNSFHQREHREKADQRTQRKNFFIFRQLPRR